MRFALALAVTLVVALAALPLSGALSDAEARAACPANPSPPDAADPSIIVDQPAANATVSSPVSISGKARTFEANVRITIFDASGAVLVDTFTTAAEAGPALSPFSASVAFSVTSAQAGCIRVFEESAQDGSPRNVVQVEVNLSPATTPPKTGSAGLQDDSSGKGHLALYLAGGLALLGASVLALKRNLWD